MQSKDTVVEVYASDFTEGTYRILEPGIYKVMEDIEFEMNVGDHTNPNEEGMEYIQFLRVFPEYSRNRISSLKPDDFQTCF